MLPLRSTAADLTRGVIRLLAALDHRALTELSLANGRRADIIALDRCGGISIVEVKASVADYRADGKWPEYLAFCDAFYFAVAPEFPLALLPAEVGIITADAYSAAMLRSAPHVPLPAARRKAVTLRFARAAAGRLSAVPEPLASGDGIGW